MKLKMSKVNEKTFSWIKIMTFGMWDVNEVGKDPSNHMLTMSTFFSKVKTCWSFLILIVICNTILPKWMDWNGWMKNWKSMRMMCWGGKGKTGKSSIQNLNIAATPKCVNDVEQFAKVMNTLTQQITCAITVSESILQLIQRYDMMGFILCSLVRTTSYVYTIRYTCIKLGSNFALMRHYFLTWTQNFSQNSLNIHYVNLMILTYS